MGYFYNLLGVQTQSENQEFLIGGEKFLIRDGILRHLASYSHELSHTRDSYAFMWKHTGAYHSDENLAWTKESFDRHYYPDRAEILERFVPNGAKVLDAGCGAGVSAICLFGQRFNDIDYLGVDMSGAINFARTAFLARGLKHELIQMDLTKLPIPPNSLDFIFSNGVLHHSNSVRETLISLSKLLKPGGAFLFWVMRDPPPLKELSEQFIRQKLLPLSDEEAMEQLKPIAKLGEALCNVAGKITLDEPVPVLDIPSGEYSVHEFVHHYLLKVFHFPGFSLERNTLHAYDVYRPLNAHKHSETELRQHCEAANLDVERVHLTTRVGITFLARKRAT